MIRPRSLSATRTNKRRNNTETSYQVCVRNVFIVLFLVASGIISQKVLANHQGSAHEVESVKEKAHRLYAHGNLIGAVEVLRIGVETYPQNPQLHFMLANAFFRRNDWSKAIEHYEEASRLRRWHPDTYLGLGHAYYFAAKKQHALAAWRIALDQSPNDILPRLAFAVGLNAVGRSDEARRNAIYAIGLDPEWMQRVSIDIRWTSEMIRVVTDIIQQSSTEYPH